METAINQGRFETLDRICARHVLRAAHNYDEHNMFIQITALSDGGKKELVRILAEIGFELAIRDYSIGEQTEPDEPQ